MTGSSLRTAAWELTTCGRVTKATSMMTVYWNHLVQQTATRSVATPTNAMSATASTAPTTSSTATATKLTTATKPTTAMAHVANPRSYQLRCGLEMGLLLLLLLLPLLVLSLLPLLMLRPLLTLLLLPRYYAASTNSSTTPATCY